MRLPLRAGLLAAVLTATAPAGALAATVPPGGNIQDAVDAAANGEVITLEGGTYEQVVTIDKPLTIEGRNGATIAGTGTEDADTVTVEAAGVVLKTLGLASTRGAAVRTTGDGGALVQQAVVTRTGGATGTPALAGDGEGGLQVDDTVAANTVGPVVVVTAGDENAVRRSTLASTEAAGTTSDALRLEAATAGARKLVADSSILIGGAKSAGVRVATQGAPGEDVSTLVMRHDTVIAAANGVVLDAQQPKAPAIGTPTGPAGSIDASVGSSIVHGASVAKGDPAPALPVFEGSTVKLAFANSDTPGVAEADKNAQATVTSTGGQYTADTAKLFGPGLRLRADSPALDKGLPVAAGESDKDIDGQGRANGPTDIGADEFVNLAPKAGFTVSNPTPAQGETVTFTSTATDPNAGDAITTFFWDFGDGQTATTDTPTVTHTYSQIGAFTARFAARDRGGAISDVATTAVTVKDGAAPVVKITTPKDKSRLRLNPKAKKKKHGKKAKRPRPLPLTVIGTVADATGVASVEVAITHRKTARSKTCRQYTGRKLVKRECTDYVFRKAKLSGDGWTLVTRKKLRLRPGRYELRARGTDTNGVVGGPVFSGTEGSLVRVTVR